MPAPRRIISRLVLLGLGLPGGAWAQSAERPVLPFKSLAGEDGVHVLYSNPALMNFDRDPGYAFYYDTTELGTGLDSIAVATTGLGLGTGIAYREYGDGAAGWWTVTSGASLRVSKGLSFGSVVHWQLPAGGENNFVSWDIGAGWRPSPYLGFGGSVLNLGSPAPDLGVNTRYGVGLAVRPWGDALTFGADYVTIAPPEGTIEQRAVASLKAHPARGLWLRAYGDVPLQEPGEVVVGGAVEVRFADLGLGVDARAGTESAAIGGGAYLTSIPRDDQIFASNKDVAVFRFDEPYPYNPRGGLLSAPGEGYLTLLRRLDDAASDPRVRGILLDLQSSPFSMAQVEEIRGILQRARENRKPVVAYLDQETGNGAYLLASGCDRVYLHPAGQLDLVGLSAELQYLRGTLDLVGIEPQFSKQAEYKSAPEQFTRFGASDASREQMNALLDDLDRVLTTGIAAGRGKTVEDVKRLIDGGPYTPQEALNAGLIDGLVYRDELETTLAGTFPKDFNLVEDYGRNVDTSGWATRRAIAVVTVDGVIASGESSPGGLFGGASTGSRTVVQALEQAADASAIKAVVLRVDSPGGSSFASDEIWRAVEKVQEEGKPVIVSMGGYAASGGYYVSAGADAIYALPSTVTGSIGVYSGKMNAERLFETLKLETEFYDRGRNASMFSSSKPFDDLQVAALDRLTLDTYRQFKERVSAGRGLSAEQVETVARGRVWSGTAAAERGLVDAFGGFPDAVERARVAAGLREDQETELVIFDPWARSGDGSLGARLVRVVAPKLRVPEVQAPEALRPWLDLQALEGETVFMLLPYRLEVE